MTAGLVYCSSVLVHLSNGTIEAHFHFFILIGLIALYQDWVPFVWNVVFTVLSHGLGSGIAADLMYNHPAAQSRPWNWAVVHGVAVLAACIGVIVFWKNTELEQRRSAGLASDLAAFELAAVQTEAARPGRPACAQHRGHRHRHLRRRPAGRQRAVNELLAVPPEVDLRRSTLGFHVVGRLAQRLGLGVSLAHTPGGGVTALVTLPDELVSERRGAVAGRRRREPSGGGDGGRRPRTRADGTGLGTGTGGHRRPAVDGCRSGLGIGWRRPRRRRLGRPTRAPAVVGAAAITADGGYHRRRPRSPRAGRQPRGLAASFGGDRCGCGRGTEYWWAGARRRTTALSRARCSRASRSANGRDAAGPIPPWRGEEGP